MKQLKQISIMYLSAYLRTPFISKTNRSKNWLFFESTCKELIFSYVTDGKPTTLLKMFIFQENGCI